MTDIVTRSSVTAVAETIDLDVRALRIKLDEQSTPYIQGDLVCELTPDAETLDPRDDIRVQIDVHQEWEQPTHADQDRSFNLMITARRIDRVQSTITFKVASDEAKLLLLGNAGDTYQQFQIPATTPLMLRTLVDDVLAVQGLGPLEAGAANADITVLRASTNLLPNGNVRTAIGQWDNGGATGTTTRQTGLAGGPVPGVTTFVRCAFTANSGNGVGGPRSGGPTTNETIVVAASTIYGVSAWVRSNVAKKVRLGVVWYDSANVAIGASVFMPTIQEPTLVANTWTFIESQFTSPSNAAKARIVLAPSLAVQWVNTNNFDLIGGSFEVQPEWKNTVAGWPPHGFDGATAADTYYSYGWDGTASQSSSHRTPLFERNPDSTLWQSGQYLWDFVDPLVKAAGLRLFCDEAQDWWLVDPLTYTIAGTITIDDDHALTAADEIDLETGDWADNLIAVYRWIDSDGVTQEQIQTVGVGTVRTLRFDFSDTPYPGPGAAEALLDRAQLRGRVLQHDALLDLDATPTMAITSDISEAPDVLDDVIASVEFTWAEDSDSTLISTRGAAA